MQENDVGAAAQGNIGEHIARRRVDCEQYAGIAGAQQPTRGRIEVQSMRSRRRDLVLLQDPGWITSIDRDDPRRRGDVDEERLARRVVDRPRVRPGTLTSAIRSRRATSTTETE